MVGHLAVGNRPLERQGHEVIGRRARQAQPGVRRKAEAAVVGRITEDHAAGHAAFAEAAQAAAHQRAADAAALQGRRDGQRAQAPPAPVDAADRHRRERDVADHVVGHRGHEGEPQRAGVPQGAHDPVLGVLAERVVAEGVLRDPVDGRFVAAGLIADHDVQEIVAGVRGHRHTEPSCSITRMRASPCGWATCSQPAPAKKTSPASSRTRRSSPASR